MDASKFAVLKDAVSGIQSPASPIGDFPEIAKLFQVQHQLPLSQAGAGFNAFNEGTQVDNDKMAREAAARAEAQRIKDMNDPSKFQQLPKKDGGYQFLDPAGKEISAETFARATQQDLGKVLNQSRNPIDIGFNEDWKNLDSYIKAKTNAGNNKDALKKAQDIEKIVWNTQKVDLSKLKIEQVIQQFRNQYPTVFGGNRAGVKAGTTYLPQYDSGDEAADEDWY